MSKNVNPMYTVDKNGNLVVVGEATKTKAADKSVDNTPAFVLDLAKIGKEMNPKWYLSRDDMMACVTAESSNETLGITAINIFQPTTNQSKAGIVCKVQVVTPVAKFNNISVMTSKFADKAIRLVTPQHEGSNGTYYQDYSFDNNVTAQILSYVDGLIKED